MVAARGWGWGTWGEVGHRVQTSSCKMGKFWGSNVERGSYNYLYCIIHLKVDKRDLKSYHHTHKKVIRGGDACVG